MFGGITIVCGIFGTLLGGFILDKMESTISNAFKVRNKFTCQFFLETQYCADTHTRTSTHPYEHIHTHPTPMSTFERLDRLNLRFTKSPWQYGRLIVCTFTNMLMSREQTFFMPNLSFDGLTAD
jgi:hypothetical protein